MGVGVSPGSLLETIALEMGWVGGGMAGGAVLAVPLSADLWHCTVRDGSSPQHSPPVCPRVHSLH